MSCLKCNWYWLVPISFLLLYFYSPWGFSTPPVVLDPTPTPYTVVEVSKSLWGLVPHLGSFVVVVQHSKYKPHRVRLSCPLVTFSLRTDSPYGLTQPHLQPPGITGVVPLLRDPGFSTPTWSFQDLTTVEPGSVTRSYHLRSQYEVSGPVPSV